MRAARSRGPPVPGGGAGKRGGQSASWADWGASRGKQADFSAARGGSARHLWRLEPSFLGKSLGGCVMPPPGQERVVPVLGARCRTLYPFSGERHRHGLRFAAGELLTVLQAGPDGGWWEGETAEGLRGWFPASYVQLIEVREAWGGGRTRGRSVIGGLTLAGLAGAPRVGVGWINIAP